MNSTSDSSSPFAPLLAERIAAAERYAATGAGGVWQTAEARSRKFLRMQPDGPITSESARRAWGPLAATATLFARIYPQQEKSFVALARRRIDEMLAAPYWGSDPFEITINLDLVAGHSCQGLALALSWSRPEWLEPQVRKQAEQRLLTQARYLYEAAANDSVFWARTYLQNHHWIDWCGLYTAARYLESRGHAEEVAPWLARCEQELRTLQEFLPADGSGYEGVMYLQYGLNSLILWMELHREKTGEEFYSTVPFWKALPAWLIAHQSSLGTSFVSHGDGGYGTDDGTERARHDLSGIFAALAWRLGDRRSQQAALLVAEATKDMPKVLEAEAHKQPNMLLFLDPDLPGEMPWNQTPCLFEDAGEWLCRRELEGQEVLFGTKWGPPGGVASFERFVEFSKLRHGPDTKSGEVLNPDHVHADMGHFVLLAQGEPLFADMGYGVGKAIDLARESIQSSAHSVLIFGGHGQWVPSLRDYRGQPMPRCLEVGESFLHLDLAPAYPTAPLDKYERRFSWEGDGSLKITDLFRCREPLTTIFQLQCLGEVEAQPGGGIVVRGEKSKAEVLIPALPHVFDIRRTVGYVRRVSWLFNGSREETKLEFKIRLSLA